MPRTAGKVDDFRTLLPEGTRVYIAHIDGTPPIEDMVATAKRVKEEGFDVMPHFPARIIKDRATLENWIAMYQGEADVKQGLVLAGGIPKAHGEFTDSMQLLDTGLFDKAGFTHLNVAGHPEPNLDIDPPRAVAPTPMRHWTGNRNTPSAPMLRWPWPPSSASNLSRSSNGPTSWPNAA